MGHAGVTLDRVGPEQEDLRKRSKPGAIDRSKASTPTSIWMASCSSAAGPARSAMSRLLVAIECEQRGLSGDSWHLRGCQRGQSGLELGSSSTSKSAASKGVRLIISDACLGLSESAAEFFSDAAWQRCIVHWYRNIFSHVPSTEGTGDRGHAQGDPRQADRVVRSRACRRGCGVEKNADPPRTRRSHERPG